MQKDVHRKQQRILFLRDPWLTNAFWGGGRHEDEGTAGHFQFWT